MNILSSEASSVWKYRGLEDVATDFQKKSKTLVAMVLRLLVAVAPLPAVGDVL
jgi:hypothetical protein